MAETGGDALAPCREFLGEIQYEVSDPAEVDLARARRMAAERIRTNPERKVAMRDGFFALQSHVRALNAASSNNNNDAASNAAAPLSSTLEPEEDEAGAAASPPLPFTADAELEPPPEPSVYDRDDLDEDGLRELHITELQGLTDMIADGMSKETIDRILRRINDAIRAFKITHRDLNPLRKKEQKKTTSPTTAATEEKPPAEQSDSEDEPGIEETQIRPGGSFEQDQGYRLVANKGPQHNREIMKMLLNIEETTTAQNLSAYLMELVQNPFKTKGGAPTATGAARAKKPPEQLREEITREAERAMGAVRALSKTTRRMLQEEEEEEAAAKKPLVEEASKDKSEETMVERIIAP